MKTDSRTGEHRAQTFDSLGAIVVEAVAEETGVDPLELPPLYDAVDPAALDALFAPTPTGTPRTGTVEFIYHGYTVTVDCAGEPAITLDERSGD